jgi:hypothetical protein
VKSNSECTSGRRGAERIELTRWCQNEQLAAIANLVVEAPETRKRAQNASLGAAALQMRDKADCKSGRARARTREIELRMQLWARWSQHKFKLNSGCSRRPRNAKGLRKQFWASTRPNFLGMKFCARRRQKHDNRAQNANLGAEPGRPTPAAIANLCGAASSEREWT